MGRRTLCDMCPLKDKGGESARQPPGERSAAGAVTGREQERKRDATDSKLNPTSSARFINDVDPTCGAPRTGFLLFLSVQNANSSKNTCDKRSGCAFG